jgi:hypothetical protein
MTIATQGERFCPQAPFRPIKKEPPKEFFFLFH